MLKTLSRVKITGINPCTAYMVTNPNGIAAFYNEDGELCMGVDRNWLLAEELGEFETPAEFEHLTGVRLKQMYETCSQCGRMRFIPVERTTCGKCFQRIEANPGLELV